MKKILPYLALIIMMTSCQPALVMNPVATVYFTFDPVAVKSLSVDDRHISNCNIMVYDSNGALVAGCYNSDGLVTSVSFSASSNLTYRFYCVCNIGDITSDASFATEAGLANYQYSVADYSRIIDSNGAVPMTGRSDYLTVSDGMNIYIDLIRCVALVTIRIEDRGLHYASLTIDSMSIMNVPKKVSLFQTSQPVNAAECDIYGDTASAAEIAAINNGGNVNFYMFENCQGVLLPGNTTCEGKVLPSASPYRYLCSYIELAGHYDDPYSGNPRYGDFIYRFYLGGDETSDFSLVRNHHYDITIELNDEGVDEVSWRVDEELTPYARSITVSPNIYRFVGMSGMRTLSATVLPWDADQEVAWSSGNTSVAVVSSTGNVTPTGYGATAITATTTDGSNLSASSYIESYQWRRRRYRVEINTNVREHINVGYGSQEQPDNIQVKCKLECTGCSDITVCEYYFPASYDQEGNLAINYFSYTWYDTTLTLQMQDFRTFYFNYDNNGNRLTEGYCIENGQYIYYEPL